MNALPTLSLIDTLRPGHTHLTDSPNAPRLEREARRLVSEYWSDYAWLTGQVSPTSLTAVVERLERLA